MRYLILGGTGTLGRAMTKELLSRDPASEIICLSRDELKQVELKKEFPSVQTVIGDIRDKQSINEHFDGVDVVFHFAAHKRIPEMERHPLESLKTNVLGTINAAECALENDVKYFIFSSTDKACRAVNTYGACKFLSESILFSYNGRFKTNFSVYRWGNVASSRGSVIPLFKEALLAGKNIEITDPRMTRFLIKIETAVEFILSTYQSREFKVKIPQMKSTSVVELAAAIGSCLGIESFEFDHVGLRPGEKIHEDISFSDGLNVHNSFVSERFTDAELRDFVGSVL